MSDTAKYLELLAWPAVALSAMLVFQDGINGLLDGNVEIDAFGVSIRGTPSHVAAELSEKTRTLEDKTRELLSQVDELQQVNQDLAGENEKLIDLAQRCEPVEAAVTKASGELTSKSQLLAVTIQEKLSGVQAAANASKFEVASGLERKGFESLISADYRKAATFFVEANEVYPSYHNVQEISRLISGSLRSLEDPKSEPQARREVFTAILEKYSWGMPSAAKLVLKRELEGAGAAN